MARYSVELRLQGLRRFRSRLRNRSMVRGLLKIWGEIYRKFAQARYRRFSRGGGNWRDITEARKRQKKKRKNLILRETDTVLRALNPVFRNDPGASENIRGFGVELGITGRQKHPNSKKATIADITAFHNFGMGNNPRRRIIVEPNARARKMMANAAERYLQAEANKEIGT